MSRLFTAIILLFTISQASAFPSRYFCPASEDFKQENNQLVATTNYYDIKHTWVGFDKNPSGFPESPQLFKGATLANCKDGTCDLVCVYYSNVEDHTIEASSNHKPNQTNFIINENINAYLKNFQCQFTEHVDCPFIVETV
ncbi:hypothetical protein [Francisella frigiditurris]|uniref:Uncharacterized protein n=1 Tax=Francisella frigiditurris TaxID=1542390 RepID=A0A1J0KVU1_9GAMM|nr:hypothetical protein [Francisella frigiditurris]APC97831.1 hypothetical protein KX01_1067 [Francisella frigiditurris]